MSRERHARRGRHAWWLLGGLLLTATAVLETAVASDARIAIIIDDLGNQLSAGRRAIRLPALVAVAVLPHTPFGQALAREAHDRGKEVLVHVPMEPQRAELELGPGALHLGLTQPEFEATLVAAVTAVPHASGVSNHMGSRLTQSALPMLWLMRELRMRDLFFVDSYTTHLSVGVNLAHEHGVPALKRDVFLDGEPERAEIALQWRRLLAIADEAGFAVAIAHPYPVTLEFLEAALPQLDAAVYTVVPLRALLPPAAAQRIGIPAIESPRSGRTSATGVAGTIK